MCLVLVMSNISAETTNFLKISRYIFVYCMYIHSPYIWYASCMLFFFQIVSFYLMAEKNLWAAEIFHSVPRTLLFRLLHSVFSSLWFTAHTYTHSWFTAGVGVCMWTDIDRLQGKVVWTPPSPADKSCTEKETRPVVHAKNASQQIRTLLL